MLSKRQATVIGRMLGNNRN
ncbi:hypothetical protein RSAG8_14000, partial [Rhizoctonia solani AG-8 WAC10335]